MQRRNNYGGPQRGKTHITADPIELAADQDLALFTDSIEILRARDSDENEPPAD